MTGYVPNESADEVPSDFDNGGYSPRRFKQLVTSWSSRFRHSAAVNNAIQCEYQSNTTTAKDFLSLYMEVCITI